MAKELVDRLLEVAGPGTPEGFPRHYEVVVGNLGMAYSGRDKKAAQETYDDYVYQSKAGYGRIAGEPVTMLCDGEPCQNHEGAPQLEGTN